MQKKNKENYLEKIPTKNESVNWKTDGENMVVLEVENNGLFNTIAQKLFKKPKVSYIHLEEFGSFIWPEIDGKQNISEIATKVKEHFGEKAEPLYDRLLKYFLSLESYGFVKLKNKK